MPSSWFSHAERSRAEPLLHGHRFLLRAGLAIGHVFAWIFIFDFFYALSGSIPRALLGVFLLYALSQAITVILTPVASAHLRHGTRSALVWSLAFAASAFVILGSVLGGFLEGEQALWGIAAFALLLGAYRALYFVPYELNRANTPTTSRHGRVFYEILLALLPGFAGATILVQSYAPLRLLAGAAALLGLAALPILFLPNVHERFSYSWHETFRELASRPNRRLFWISLLDGAQGAALFLLWPLAVFLIVGGSYVFLGAVFSMTLLSVLLFRMLFRSFLAKKREYSLPVHVTLAISGWIGRLVAGSPFAVVIADSYAYTARPTHGASIDPFVFEQAADSGSFLDEYTALKEIGLALGRILFVAIIGAFVFLAPIVIAFAAGIVLAAIAAGLSVFLVRRRLVALP